jgi:hypothetical protein
MRIFVTAYCESQNFGPIGGRLQKRNILRNARVAEFVSVHRYARFYFRTEKREFVSDYRYARFQVPI